MIEFLLLHVRVKSENLQQVFSLFREASGHKSLLLRVLINSEFSKSEEKGEKNTEVTATSSFTLNIV